MRIPVIPEFGLNPGKRAANLGQTITKLPIDLKFPYVLTTGLSNCAQLGHRYDIAFNFEFHFGAEFEINIFHFANKIKIPLSISSL